MSSLIIAHHDIEPYLPRTFSDAAKEKTWKLATEIEQKVANNLMIPFRYGGEARIVEPASLYLQNATPLAGSTITHPVKGYPSRMKVYTKGARRAVGMDALEIAKERKSPQCWKTFHLDKIDDLELLSPEEVVGLFQKRFQTEELLSLFTENQLPPDGFVRNWNYWFRIFLAQAEAEHDLLH